jgi:dihydrofolate synthase/folylpolyglutamate synthase
MQRLTTLLGLPQHCFASIHVVGTNGKSSVTRMTAALLKAHGLATGACVSPHPARWSERVLIRGEEIGPQDFASAVERTAEAADVVNRGLEAGDVLTQFEVATAAAFVALATAHVDVAVVEAGLGGRLDATNTIPSRVTVLTSIGLDHTEWLGETELEIAAEKLAVLRDHTSLVLGRVSTGVAALAERSARERSARLIVAPEDPGEEIRMRAAGGFQRRNFALARSAAAAFLGELDPSAVAAVAAELTIPGRLERVTGDPPIVLDVAHNPDGAAAVAEALPGIASGRPVVAVLAVLADKDADAMLSALAPAIDLLVATSIPAEGPEARPPIARSARRRGFEAGELARMAAGAGTEAEAVEDFSAALARARRWARENDGMVLVTGSHYVLEPARRALGLWQD